MNAQKFRQCFGQAGQSWLVLSAVAAASLFLTPVFPSTARGDIYSYIDQQGTIHFTNVPTDPRFKKVLREWFSFRRRLQPAELEPAIARHARRHRLEPALLRAVIKAESDFNPDAVSKAGAVGLMQLMPHTAVRLDVRDAYDPEDNIGGGARHLRYLLDRFRGNLTLALAAYNAGENVVDRYHAVPPIEETRRYVAKVLRHYRLYMRADRLSEQAGLPPPAGRLTAFSRPTPAQPAAPWSAPRR